MGESRAQSNAVSLSSAARRKTALLMSAKNLYV